MVHGTINIKYIKRPSPYHAVNTVRLGYKNQSVYVVWERLYSVNDGFCYQRVICVTVTENLKPFKMVATNQRFGRTLFKMPQLKVNAVGIKDYKNEEGFTQVLYCHIEFQVIFDE